MDVAAEDLVVLEDGVEQKVEVFQEAVDAGVDHPGARRERQHEARGADGHGVGAEVRRVAARKDKLAVMLFSDKTDMIATT